MNDFSACLNAAGVIFHSKRTGIVRSTQNAVCASLLTLSCLCHASTDPACLRHLGGAFGDVECFNSLSNRLMQENRILAENIRARIPKRNKNKRKLDQYLQSQSGLKAFCDLSRESMTNWTPESVTISPRYHDYDVAYYECVYVLFEQENRFLKGLLKNATQD